MIWVWIKSCERTVKLTLLPPDLAWTCSGFDCTLFIIYWNIKLCAANEKLSFRRKRSTLYSLKLLAWCYGVSEDATLCLMTDMIRLHISGRKYYFPMECTRAHWRTGGSVYPRKVNGAAQTDWFTTHGGENNSFLTVLTSCLLAMLVVRLCWW